MGFLDNSGDIILDCLTDTGRMRLTQRATEVLRSEFALGDDEINLRDLQQG